jgi:hypothetical protein
VIVVTLTGMATLFTVTAIVAPALPLLGVGLADQFPPRVPAVPYGYAPGGG